MVGLVERTQEMFDSIPDEGACIVTLTNDMAKWLRFRLPQWRGDDLARRCRIIGIHQMRSVCKLWGEPRRVITHFVFDERAKTDVKAEVHRLAHGCNAQRASA